MHKNLFKTILLALFLLGTLTAWADGEQINTNGTRWVDPVVLLKLQDIDRTDLQHSYCNGDIDINKVIKEKGLKIYGMRLKPIAAAGWVPDVARKNSPQATWEFSYDKVMGVEGVALHEAGFCIYADDGVSRSYDVEYTITSSGMMGHRTVVDKIKARGKYSFNGLTFVPTDGGIGFSYSFNGEDKYSTVTTITKQSGKTRTKVSDQTLTCEKPLSVNPTLGHFIYFKGDGHLLAMISASATAMTSGDRKGTPKNEMATMPWTRIYFEVEEIQIDAAVAAAEMGEELLDGEAGTAQLDAQDKAELKDYIKDLMTWMKGEGDPLGLGKHTDEKEGAVIGAIATVASILLGSGVAGFIGGTGAQIASNITNTIIGGGGGAELPPPVPDGPDMPAVEPKRPEEEENPKPEPKPDDGKLFHPTDYPDLAKRYFHEGADGTLTYTDPATGKRTEFYPTSDGRWTKCYDDSEPKLTTADLEERMRFSYENQGYVLQNAETAARNVKEQREQWDAMNKRDLERGYTDDMKAYSDMKAEQERAIEKEKYIEKLADKYHTTVDNLQSKIRQEQALAEEEFFYQQEIAEQWKSATEMAEKVDKVCETAVNIMGECVPGGKAVKNAYTFTKSTMVAASESYADGKSLGESALHVAVGMGQGALGVIQNQAGDLTSNPLKEYAIVIGTESVKDGMAIYAKTGSVTKTLSGMANTAGKKSVDYGVGKLFSKGVKYVQDSAAQSLDPRIIHIDKDTGLRFSDRTAETIKKWFGSGDVDISKTVHYKDIMLIDAKGGLGWMKTDNVTFGGSIDFGKMFEAAGPEILGKFDAFDWGGDVSQTVWDESVQFGSDLHAIWNDAAAFRVDRFDKKDLE